MGSFFFLNNMNIIATLLSHGCWAVFNPILA